MIAPLLWDRAWGTARGLEGVLRTAARRGRWVLIAALVPLVITLQATIVTVLARPFDRAQLDADSQPLVLLDVRGDEIVALPAAGADRTRWTPLGQVPTIAVSAVIESEDDGFWTHRGIDGLGVMRAAWLDLGGGHYGASTLTMQLARMLISEGAERSVTAKVRESLLALRMERAVDKRTILEQWLNRAYFGNGAHGFEAAARLYFGRPASALSDGEAALLAVIPRAPTGYDPLLHLPAALRRRDYVLGLLVRRGVISAEAAWVARATPIAVGRHRPLDRAPHFTQLVVDELPPAIRRAGGVVRTSLDLQLQRTLQTRVSEQVAQLHSLNLDQAGMVVLDTRTSEVRAMIGSAGWAQPGGQINITTRRRHPGSALKPFVYATAIEAGESPGSIAWDIREASEDYFSPHAVEHGPVRFREALASSYNFAAVDVLASVGIPRVMTTLRQAGVAKLEGAPRDYGLRLALGAAKVRLVDLAAGYELVVRGGMVGHPHAVRSATLPDGTRWAPMREPDRRVVSPTTAWLVMDMMADPEARRPGFGMELPFDLPFRIAAKTGTARGFTDTWAVGATREVIVGAWAGTFDGTSMHDIVGMDAAAPLVRAGMLAVAGGRPLTLPGPPADIVDVDVCEISGMLAGEHCPRIHEHAARGHAPAVPCTWHDASGITTYPARAAGWLARRKYEHVRP